MLNNSVSLQWATISGRAIYFTIPLAAKTTCIPILQAIGTYSSKETANMKVKNITNTSFYFQGTDNETSNLAIIIAF